MPYNVNFTDSNNKTPITVFDNTSNSDTSLNFPGRNVTGYGQIIAENFLALLENFASASPPESPTEGQLWYDTTEGINLLKIWDNTAWVAASGIQKGPVAPTPSASKVGELWVDTTNQQLRIYTGTQWLLVGPSESSVDGLRYGPAVEKIADADNITRYILIFYIADIPVIIFSKDSFTPKTIITGFDIIRAGINIPLAKDTQGNVNQTIADQFLGGFLPTVYGTTKIADSLNVPGVPLPVEASKFLRSNVINTLEFGINIRNNASLVLGVDGTFNIGTSPTSARIYNAAAGSSIDIQTNRNGIPTTVVQITENTVGINKLSPTEALDVVGNIKSTGSLIVTDITASTNLNNGSIRTSGGVSITKNLLVGSGASITGTLQTNVIQPSQTDTHDLGTSLQRWNTVRAKTVIADTIQGVLDGSISGNANTATSLKNVTTFQIAGDVESQNTIKFDGQIESSTKIFNTVLTANIIAGKSEPFPNLSRKTDYVLTYRTSEQSQASSGLLKQTRDTFVGDLGIPLGTILPYAGSSPPRGFLFCDGSEVERSKFPDLFDIIGTTYNGTAPLVGLVVNNVPTTYRLPDLRGRFALGKDNMDNGLTVPVTTGGFSDAGGGPAGRNSDNRAQTLGGGAGTVSTTLTLTNLPEHSHTLNSGRQNYNAIALTTTLDPSSDSTSGPGPTAPGAAQYLKDSGGIRKPEGVVLGTPVSVINPYLTINYIIRSGPPVF